LEINNKAELLEGELEKNKNRPEVKVFFFEKDKKGK